jgi:hypothetical protein
VHAPHAAEVEITAAILARRKVAEVGQTDASFVRLQVAEVKTTDALKRMDFETSVAPTEASKYNSLTGLGRKHRSKFARCLLVQCVSTFFKNCH